MCYASGSIEQVTRTCIMCKVYPPRQVGCPHQPLGLCRNRQNHPRFDVLYFRSAELDLFNGCGYCKWASQNSALTNDKPWSNTGWPGCCRPPKPSEFSYIKGLNEWLAVNKIHGTPIPPDAAHGQHTPSGSMKLPSPRRDQNRTSLSNIVSAFDRASPNMSANSTLRRKRSKSLVNMLDKEPESPFRTPNSKIGEQKPIFPGPYSTLKIKRLPEDKDKVTSSITPRLPILSTPSKAASAITSSSSSSASVTTVSEGFTDYLSDESDQELQRQAEARAAELAIAKHEKDEFDAALQTVRHLSLQPPPEWNPHLPVARSAANRCPRESFSNTQNFPMAVAQSRH